MPPQSIPKEMRARYLRGRLEPESLLDDLAAAKQANRSFVQLIGIKGAVSELREMEEVYMPQFQAEIESDAEIGGMLDELRTLGFEFAWGEYLDPSGIEFTLRLLRTPAAESYLRRGRLQP